MVELEEIVEEVAAERVTTADVAKETPEPVRPVGKDAGTEPDRVTDSGSGQQQRDASPVALPSGEKTGAEDGPSLEKRDPKEVFQDPAGEEPAQEAGQPCEGPDDEFQDSMDEEALRNAAIADAEAIKAQGNQAFGSKEYARAIELYSAAVDACPDHPNSSELRAICHANRGLCHMQLEQYTEAVEACTASLELKPGYVKALLRRSQAHEKLDKLEEALADAQKVLEIDSTDATASRTVRKLQPIVEERREKLKEEMLGKLKELGNSILGNFGLSLDNFKAVQDPETGSYSINFQS